MHTCGGSKQHHIQGLEFELLLVLLILDLQIATHERRLIGCNPGEIIRKETMSAQGNHDSKHILKHCR